MKKVLILAYDFPPYVSVGGLRPYSWFKYFKKYGLYPVVITRQWQIKYRDKRDYVAPGYSDKVKYEKKEDGLIIRAPYKPNLANRIILKYGDNRFEIFRKAITAFYEFFQWVLPVGPKYGLYQAANEYLKNNKVDVIIATGEPFILFKYASLLSKKYKIPWVADYRDLWSQHLMRSSNKFLRFFNEYLEKKYLKSVSFITTTIEFFKIRIKEFNKESNTSVFVVLNGYHNTIKTKDTYLNNSFKIVYVGSLLPWHPIEGFMKVLSDLISTGKEIFVEFWGTSMEDFLNELKSKYNLDKYIFVGKRIPVEEAFKKMEEGSVLLLFNEYVNNATKIYDYLAARRKILFLYENDKEALKLKKEYYDIDDKGVKIRPQIDIIKETNSGIIVKDEKHLRIVLEELYKEFKQKGYIECNSHGIEKYSREKQTEKLAEILKKMLR